MCRPRTGVFLSIGLMASTAALLYGIPSQEWVVVASNVTQQRLGLSTFCMGANCEPGLTTALAQCRPMGDVRLRFDSVIAFFSIGIIAAALGSLIALSGHIGLHRDVALWRFADAGSLGRTEAIAAVLGRRINASRLLIGVLLGFGGAISLGIGIALFQDSYTSWLFCGRDMCTALTTSPAVIDRMGTSQLSCRLGSAWIVTIVACALAITTSVLQVLLGANLYRGVAKYNDEAKQYRASAANSRVSSAHAIMYETEPTAEGSPAGAAGDQVVAFDAPTPRRGDEGSSFSSQPRPSRGRAAKSSSAVDISPNALTPATVRRSPTPPRPIRRLRKPHLVGDAIVEPGWERYVGDETHGSYEQQGLFWNQAEELYFDTNAQCFYDPRADQWYNPEADEWFSV